MKQFRVTFIAIAILIVSIVAYLIIGNLFIKKPDDSRSDIVREKVLEFLPGHVVKIESFYKERIEVEHKDGKWISNSHDDLTVLDTNVLGLLASYVNMEANVIVNEGEEIDFSNFGFLEDPSYITLHFKDGTYHKLLLGNTTLSGSELFVMFEGGAKVYKISSTYAKKMQVTRATYSSDKIFSSLNKDRISSIELERNGQTIYLIKADFSKDEKSWLLHEPVKIQGETKKIDSLVESLRVLYLGDLVDANIEDLSIYGLDIPLAKYIVKDNNLTKTLEIGDKTPDGYYRYCTVDGSKHVYLMSTLSLGFVDDPVISYAFAYPFLENQIELSHVKVTIGQDVYNLDYDVTEVEENYWFNGENVNKPGKDLRSDFKKITTAMYILQLEVLEEKTLEAGSVLCSIEYITKDGSKTLVEYLERDETTSYIYVNGEYFNGYMYTRRIFAPGNDGLKEVIESFASKIS